MSENKNSGRKLKKWLLMGLPVLAILAGVYVLLLVFTPSLDVATYQPPDWSSERIQHLYPEGNYLQIDKLDLIVPIGTTRAALNGGSWHKFAERSNPEVGGNMILTGHRFRMGWTPQTIAQSSPFYHTDRLEIGDEIVIFYNDKEYKYTVSKIDQVKPSATSIETNTDEPKLTLYTCTLRGAADGRVVIEALPDTSL